MVGKQDVPAFPPSTTAGTVRRFYLLSLLDHFKVLSSNSSKKVQLASSWVFCLEVL